LLLFYHSIIVLTLKTKNLVFSGQDVSGVNFFRLVNIILQLYILQQLLFIICWAR